MSLSKSDGETLAAAEVNTFPQKAEDETISGAYNFSGSNTTLTGGFMNTGAWFITLFAGGTSMFVTVANTDGIDYRGTWNFNGTSVGSAGNTYFTNVGGGAAFFAGINRNTTEYRIVADPAGTPVVAIAVDASGKVILANLPTSDPTSTGMLWNDNGTLKVSA